MDRSSQQRGRKYKKELIKKLEIKYTITKVKEFLCWSHKYNIGKKKIKRSLKRYISRNYPNRNTKRKEECACGGRSGEGREGMRKGREAELRIQGLWNNLEVLTCIIRILEGRRSRTVNGTMEKYEDTMAKNFPRLVTGIKILI